MLLKHLKISNYRALKEVEMPLSAFVCLTGENNAGKSSVLQALSLFLSGSTLAPSNYFDPAQTITIAVTLAEIGEPDLVLLAPEHRARIEPLIANQSITLVRQYGTDGKSQLGYFGMVPLEPRFGDPAREELMKGKKGAELRAAVIAQFPELTERANEITTQKSAGELISQLAAGLPAEAKALKFVALPTGKDFSITPMLPERIYIPAVKDLADETKTSESSSFGKILGILLEVIEPKLAEDQALFDRLSKKLTRVLQPDGTLSDERLDEIKAIEASIQGYVQESFSAVKLRIEIPPPELRTVLSTAKILANDGVESALELKGDGLRRAVVFSILRAYVKLALSGTAGADNRRYLLMFEEPELFLHPDAQRILFGALQVFSRSNQVVVTTHSPLFLGPEATATFVRLSKTVPADATKPFTSAVPIDLTGMGARDEFQIICFENNNAAFFAKKVVLIEGDSDQIALPHIMQVLGNGGQAALTPTAFVRVLGKGSIRRYRSFFARFGIKVLVVADLDVVLDGFAQLDPDAEIIAARQLLLVAIDAATTAAPAKEPNADDIKKAQDNGTVKQLWAKVRAARVTFEADPSKFADLKSAVDAFFAWERKSIRYDELRSPTAQPVVSAKADLLAKLRKSGVFLWHKGAIDDYYPAGVAGPDKPSRAQSFRNTVTERPALIGCCPAITCPATNQTKPEFEFLGEFVAG
jgi:putative ATP-dependent endonuclease of OLD family